MNGGRSEAIHKNADCRCYIFRMERLDNLEIAGSGCIVVTCFGRYQVIDNAQETSNPGFHLNPSLPGLQETNYRLVNDLDEHPNSRMTSQNNRLYFDHNAGV